MKRLLALLVVLVPVSLFVAGCGGGGGGGKAAVPSAPPSKDEMQKMAKIQMEMMKKTMATPSEQKK